MREPCAGEEVGLLLLVVVLLLLLVEIQLFFRLYLVDVGAYFFCGQVCDDGVGLHHGDLDVSGARLDDLQKRLDGELDTVLLRSRGLVLLVVLLQELAHGLGVSADGLCAPRRVDAAGLGLVELGFRVTWVEPRDQRRHAERAHTAGLRVALLHARDVPGQVVHGDRVLQCQAVRLRLHPCLLDKDSRVRVQPCKGEHHMVVDLGYLGGRDSGILQLQRRPSLAAKHHAVGALDADGTGASFHRLQCVLDLENMSIGGKYG